MVGVPGKSKGCSTCRRRKKGCDQQRPICGQCLAGGYRCGGYQRERTFILHPHSQLAEHATYVPYIKLPSAFLMQTLDNTAIAAHCRGLFWNIYMPSGDCIVRDEFILKCGHPMDWTEIMHELPQEEACLDNAFSALSLSRVGKEKRDPRLLRESARVYGKALRDLQMALYDSERMHSDEVLTASMFLGLYEVFEGSTLESKSWHTHALGAARLIQLRGCKRHQTRPAHHVFLGSRIPTIYAAILQRKATYLDSEQWRTIPWANQHRTYFDRLIDIATRIPGLLEEMDITCIGDVDQVKSVRKQEILKDLAQVQRAMDSWKRGVKKEGVAHDVPHKRTDPDAYPFDVEIHFENHLFISAHMVYYCCSLIVAEAAETLMADLAAHSLPATPASDTSTAEFDELFNAHRQAICIAQTIPFCTQPDMGALGACIINFPASVAYEYFQRRQDTAIATWMDVVFYQVKSRGFQYDAHLLWSAYDTVNNLKADEQCRENKSQGSDSRHESQSPSSASDSSAKPTDTPTSDVVIKFVHEDPSQYYVDTGDESS